MQPVILQYASRATNTDEFSKLPNNMSYTSGLEVLGNTDVLHLQKLILGFPHHRFDIYRAFVGTMTPLGSNR